MRSKPRWRGGVERRVRERSNGPGRLSRRVLLATVVATLTGTRGPADAQQGQRPGTVLVVARVTATVQRVPGGHSAALRLVPVVVVSPEPYVDRALALRIWLPEGAAVGECIRFFMSTALLGRALAGPGRLLVRPRSRTIEGPCG